MESQHTKTLATNGDLQNRDQTDAEKDCSDEEAKQHDQEVQSRSGSVASQTAEQDLEKADEQPTQQHEALATEVYSIFTVPQKRLIILTGSFVSWFSPMSGSIYFPALNQIAQELGVTSAKVNITVTTYLVRRNPSPSLCSAMLTIADCARPRADDDCRLQRQGRPTTSVHNLLHHLHHRQPRPGVAE